MLEDERFEPCQSVYKVKHHLRHAQFARSGNHTSSCFKGDVERRVSSSDGYLLISIVRVDQNDILTLSGWLKLDEWRGHGA